LVSNQSTDNTTVADKQIAAGDQVAAGDGDVVVDDGLGVEDAEPPRERLSWRRLGAVVAIVAALVVAGVVATRARSGTTASAGAVAGDKSWSVPYVDVTLTPTYEFQNPQSNPARDIALAFVVADPKAACTPSWGGAYSMDAASESLELDRRITQLRAAGGDIMVSFGGQANQELAFACTDETKLTAAYMDVVQRYGAQVIDLDIEGPDVADMPSIQRRARAIAAVQKQQLAAGKKLAVWLTMPVATTGLTSDGVALLRATIAGGVDVTGVNAMTMDFGDAAHPTADMLVAAKAALVAAAKQIGSAYAAEGITLDEAQRWAHLGATPMIGQNDVAGEVFTLDDAKGLAAFATAQGLARVSTWSLNRDGPCDASFADVKVLSNTCSGVSQTALDFANVFTALPGRAPNLPQSDAVTVPDRSQTVDDPATSPYPIWRPDAQYPEGYRVVRSGVVYQAKWYNQAQEPSTASATPGAAPWALVGPVGTHDVPFTPSTLAPGTHPDWEPATLYAKGDTILFNGLPYQARWPNKDDVPSSLFPVGPDSAWNPVFTIAGEPTS
jgi:chitinase